MDHMEISCTCGTLSLYHILCISETTKCINCNAHLNAEMMLQVKDAKQTILLKYKKEKLREKKQVELRKQIQNKIIQKVLPLFKKQC